MKKLFVALMVCMTVNLFAQEEKTSKINVSGQGKTLEDARQNALRSAIEQAFGAFISSKTELLNDNLVKDEIVSISNGNIQKYTILSEVEIPNVGYATTLEAIVSINQLTKFCESKGIQVEFAGSLFGANMKQQKLNEEAETKAIINLCETSKEILKKALDFEVAPSEPKNVGEDKFEINFTFTMKGNENYNKFKTYFIQSIKKISMSSADSIDYVSLSKPIYSFKLDGNDRKSVGDLGISVKLTGGQLINLRNKNSISVLKDFFITSCQFCYDFEIKTNIDTIRPMGLKQGVSKEESNFKSFGEKRIIYSESPVFYGRCNNSAYFFSQNVRNDFPGQYDQVFITVKPSEFRNGKVNVDYIDRVVIYDELIQVGVFKKVYTVSEIEKISKVSIVNLNNQQ